MSEERLRGCSRSAEGASAPQPHGGHVANARDPRSRIVRQDRRGDLGPLILGRCSQTQTTRPTDSAVAHSARSSRSGADQLGPRLLGAQACVEGAGTSAAAGPEESGAPRARSGLHLRLQILTVDPFHPPGSKLGVESSGRKGQDRRVRQSDSPLPSPC